MLFAVLPRQQVAACKKGPEGAPSAGESLSNFSQRPAAAAKTFDVVDWHTKASCQTKW